jgi:ATP-dependent protease ClpP protease subunit
MLRLDGVIGDDWTAERLSNALAAETSDRVDITLNSPGGIATEGAAMLAVLQQERRPVGVTVQGIAASAASLLMMGATWIEADRSSLVMIHDPAAMTLGTADDHLKNADTLNRMAGVYADAYARRTGNRVQDVRRWMRDETWMDAEQAVLLGFADSVSEIEDAPQAVAMASLDARDGAHLALAIYRAMKPKEFAS